MTKKKPKTNYERIISMSKEEMAKSICDNVHCDSCPISKVDDLYFEAYCPAKTGEEEKLLLEWLESEEE